MLAAGVGIGLSSVVAWLMLVAGVSSRTQLLALDAALWIAALVAMLALRRRWLRTPPGEQSRHPTAAAPLTLAIIACLGVGAVALTSFIAQSMVLPHGTWDTWAIWNLKARFVVRGIETVEWRDVLSPAMGWSHPDYPLLLPLAVARAWIYHSCESIAVPVACTAVFAVAAPALVGVSIARARGVTDGLVAAAFVAASPAFVRHAPAQCADVPLGYFIVATFVLIAEAERGANARLWALAG